MSRKIISIKTLALVRNFFLKGKGLCKRNDLLLGEHFEGGKTGGVSNMITQRKYFSRGVHLRENNCNENEW